MKMPKVSIIVPIYNVQKYLKRCMDSILSQTLKDIEIIMVDDGSPDNCPVMCDDYAKRDERIRVIHKKNGGLGFARNSGLEIATGEFIAFVDSDDYIAPNMYENLYVTAKEYNLDTVYCNINFYDNENVITPRYEVKTPTFFIGKEDVKIFLLDMIGPKPQYNRNVKYLMSACRVIYSRRLIEEHNIKFCSEKKNISEDIIFHLEYLPKANKIGFLPEAFYYYCYNESSLTNQFSKEKSELQILLLKEIKLKLDNIMNPDEYLYSYMRFVLARIHVILFGDFITAKKNGENINKTLKNRLNEDFWQEIISSYPFNNLPLKHRIIYYPFRMRLITIIKWQIILKYNRAL